MSFFFEHPSTYILSGGYMVQVIDNHLQNGDVSRPSSPALIPDSYIPSLMVCRLLPVDKHVSRRAW